MSAPAAVSFGGGRQTVAMLVLAAQERIPHRLFLFANVGDRAEGPRTLDYFHEHALPYAERHGIELRMLRWVDRQGRERDLYDDLLRQENSLTIPLRDSGGFGPRKCTSRYKIEVVAREMKRLGATVENPAEVAIGFSVDEIERARTPGVVKQQPWTRTTYPLLDLRLRVSQCLDLVTRAGLPPAPRSAGPSWTCPNLNPKEHRMADLAPFEGLPVTAVGIEMPSAAGGLRDPMKFDPVELHHGDEGQLIIRYRVQKVRFDPIRKDEPDGDQRRVAVLDVQSAMFTDDDETAQRLAEYEQKIARAKEQAEGVQRLETEEELAARHDDGEHADDLVDACPTCQAEVAAAEAGD